MSNNQPLETPPAGDDDVAPACWICLEEGPDESGHPLVRDCSCRGDAGFSHVPCIIQYAKTKSADFTSNPGEQITTDFTGPWEMCPHFNQLYQHQLATDLANALLSFMDERYPPDKIALKPLFLNSLKFQALRTKIHAIRSMSCFKDPVYFSEGKQTAYEALEIAQKITTYHQERGKYCEALAHEELSFFHQKTDGDYAEEIKHIEKARDAWMFIGEKEEAKMMKHHMECIKECTNDEGIRGEAVLKSRQGYYDTIYQLEGEHSTRTMMAGMNLADALHWNEHGIECERLIRNIVDVTVRVLGAEHDMTKSAVKRLALYKLRVVKVMFHPTTWFIALRYVAASDEYILMAEADWQRLEGQSAPRDTDYWETITVSSDDIVFKGGTPVVCHGLKMAPHLNGKIGDLRGYDQAVDRFEVYFEDKHLSPARVKPENMRIVFDLPK